MELSNIRLILIFCPIIVSILIYYVSKFLFKHERRAFHFTVSWTTIFYIIAVVILIQYMFSIDLTGIVSIILLMTISIILIVQWKTRTEVILKNGLKLLWRFSFLIFIPSYIGLIIYYVLKNFILV